MLIQIGGHCDDETLGVVSEGLGDVLQLLHVPNVIDAALLGSCSVVVLLFVSVDSINPELEDLIVP